MSVFEWFTNIVIGRYQHRQRVHIAQIAVREHEGRTATEVFSYRNRIFQVTHPANRVSVRVVQINYGPQNDIIFQVKGPINQSKAQSRPIPSYAQQPS